MKIRRHALALVLFAVGCATNTGVPPNRNELARLKDTEVRLVTHQRAPFVLMSAAKVGTGALFGIVGGAVAANSMEKAGEQLITDYQLTDPAVTVRDRVAEALQATYGVRTAVADTVPPTDSMTDLTSRFGRETVLDTRTLGWQLIYYPTDWTHHYVIYAGRARILRLSDGKTLWDGRCLAKLPDPAGSRRTMDEYRANDGALLKQKLDEAADGCASQLIAQLNGNAPPG
jgi:hypothetical protein